jgi:hypothetical protein
MVWNDIIGYGKAWPGKHEGMEGFDKTELGIERQGVAMDSLKFHPSPPCPTPETALPPFQGWPARRAGGLQPSSTPFGKPHAVRLQARWISTGKFLMLCRSIYKDKEVSGYGSF